MKTIETINPQFKEIFEYLLTLGWKQPIEGFSDRYVLECPKRGWCAEEMNFPLPHVGIINKSGTTCLIRATELHEVQKHITF